MCRFVEGRSAAVDGKGSQKLVKGSTFDATGLLADDPETLLW